MKAKISKGVRRMIIGLPLAGIVIANFFATTPRANQFLILITLVWFQVFILAEVFSTGN